MINLRRKDRETICKIAENSFKDPIKLLAYGSRVNGDSHEGSDLDLAVRAQNLKPVYIIFLSKFREGLQESNIPTLVQVIDWARIPDSFKANIVSHYEVLFSLNH